MSGLHRLLGGPPQRGPTWVALPGVILLLALSGWQFARHVERAAENELRATMLARPAVTLGEGAIERFRRVRVTGRFAHDRERYMYARSLNGNEGYYVLTPLLRDGAGAVLINRGWVPVNRLAPERRAAGQVEGPVTIEGVLRTETRRADWSPDNRPDQNRWFWFDLPAIIATLDMAVTPGFYVDAGPAPNPGGFPLGGQTQPELPRPHLQYAFTWLALAFALGAIYVVHHRKRKS